MKFEDSLTKHIGFHHSIIIASLLKAGATLGVEEVVANDTRLL